MQTRNIITRGDTTAIKLAGMKPLKLDSFGKLHPPSQQELRELFRRARNAADADLEVAYENTDSIYDSFSAAAGAAFPPMTPMFTVPRSGGKTWAQTNMQLPGMMANGDTFLARRLRVLIIGAYPTDGLNISQLCSVTFVKGSRPWMRGPALAYPCGGGPHISAIAQVQTAPAGSSIIASFSNGVPVYQNSFVWEDDVFIRYGNNFEVDFVAETGFNMIASGPGTGATIYVFIDGKRTRQAD